MNAPTLLSKKLTLQRHMLLSIIWIFCFSHLQAQRIMVNGNESKGKLQWSDFRGKVDKSSAFAAYTFYNVGWKVKGVRPSGDSMLIDGFEITLDLSDKGSWVKMERATPELLLHEQGHFNIGILTVREAMETFKETKFSPANFKEVLPGMITNISKKYRELGVLYDKETDHSKNVEMQAKWNSFFAERLPELYNQ